MEHSTQCCLEIQYLAREELLRQVLLLQVCQRTRFSGLEWDAITFWNALLDCTTFSTKTPYWGGPFLHTCFFLRFENQKRVPSLSYCFASISIGLRPSRSASKPASKLALEVFCSNFSRHCSSIFFVRARCLSAGLRS